MTTPGAALASALSEARDRYEKVHPASSKAHAEASASMPGGNTRSTLFHTPFPLTMTRGHGCKLWDVDGNEYVDLLGEYTAGLYGHSNPVIRRAVDQALDNGWNFGGHGVMETRLASVLCERFPGLELVRFTNSGTEANLLAVATAVAATGRSHVLVFNGGYHGSVLSFGGRGIPINVPHSWVVGDYNDIPGTAALVERYAADLACILVEPMLGSGGCIPAIPEFLAALRQLATKTGAVLVFDEVMTSRMSVGGEQLRLGIKPDMTTLGKYIGGGMSFGAFGGSRQYMEAYDPRLEGALPHAGTFNNNVFSMAAGHAGLTEIFSASTATDLFGRGERLRKSLNALAAGRDAAMQWTGVGSLMTAHFQRGDIRRPDDLQPRAELRELFHLDMIDRGYYFARRGMIALSLEVGTEECDEFCAAVQDFLDARAPLLVAS